MTEASPASTTALALRLQARYCGTIGSPLYELLLERAADDVLAGGPVAAVLDGHSADEPGTMLPLRMMGAVHRLVLKGEGTELEPFYPSVGGTVSSERTWRAFRDLLGRQRDVLRDELALPVQTNEVGRCRALVGGFLTVARDTGLPLSVLEIGASAGLNLLWDRYRYEAGGLAFGEPAAPLRFADFVATGELPLDVPAAVRARGGCDAAPLDPRSERDRLLLRSFVWPDQLERFTALSRALELAAAEPATVERADAAEWAERELAEPQPGVATVLFHSIVMLYLTDETRERLVAAIEAAGARATTEAPFAWLRMELGGDEADVHLTTWPGGEERLIARAGYHGVPVRWLAPG